MIEKIKCRNCNKQIEYVAEYCSCGASTDFSKLTESRKKELGFTYFWKWQHFLFPVLGFIMWASIILGSVALFGAIFIQDFSFFIAGQGAEWAILVFGLAALVVGIGNKLLFGLFFTRWLKKNKGY